MATFFHLDGVRGVNLDLVAEWTYDEKKAAIPRKGEAEAGAGKSESVMHIVFATGHMAEYTGASADALHRYFCTYSRALT